MESNGDLFYSSISEVPAELSSVLQSHIREIPASGNLRFYYTDRDQLYSITAQQLLMNNVQRCLFYCVPARIPLHSSRPGLRTLNKGEVRIPFANSFYSLSGAMGTQAAKIRSPRPAAPAGIHLRRARHRQRADRTLSLSAQLPCKPPPSSW